MSHIEENKRQEYTQPISALQASIDEQAANIKTLERLTGEKITVHEKEIITIDRFGNKTSQKRVYLSFD